MLPGISNVLRRDKERPYTRGEGSVASNGSGSGSVRSSIPYGGSGTGPVISSPYNAQHYSPRYDAQGAPPLSSPPGPPTPSQPQQYHPYQQHSSRWTEAQASSPPPSASTMMGRTATSSSSQSSSTAAGSGISLLPEEHRARERERLQRYTLDMQQQQQSPAQGRRPSQQPKVANMGPRAPGNNAPNETTRSSSAASNSVGGRYSSSHMESSVTRLLVATKMLLEALTKWSLGERTETQVSDIYVRLGNDFNVANVAFGSYGIDMSDLASVPDDLRECLEQCLSEDASPQALEHHLPRIREIIIGLLQGLKSKQAEYKQLLMQRRASARSSKNRGDRQPNNINGTHGQVVAQAQPASPPKAASIPEQPPPPARPESSSSRHSDKSVRTGSREGPPERPEPRRVSSSHSAKSALHALQESESTEPTEHAEPPRSTFPKSRSTDTAISSNAPSESSSSHVRKAPSEGANAKSPSPAKSPPPVAKMPASASLDIASARGAALGTLSASSASGSAEEIVDVGDTADPSVRALKSREALERRASKRFSAYTFNKMGVGLSQGLGMSSYNLAAMAGGEKPSGRGHSRKQGSKGSHDASSDGGFWKGNGKIRSGLTTPSEEHTMEMKMGTETPTRRRMTGMRQSPRHSPRVAQPTSLAPPLGASQVNSSTESLPYVDAASATSPQVNEVDLPSEEIVSELPAFEVPDIPPVPPLPTLEEQARLGIPQAKPSSVTRNDIANISTASSVQPKASFSELTPRASNFATTLSLFLQLGRQTKRVTIDLDPDAPFRGLSTGKLRMLFMDKFQYSPGQEDFPSIYVKDMESGVSFELEDLGELTNGTVLTLNIEPLDQVKQHLDLTLGGITRELRELRTALHERERESFRRASSAQPHEPSFSMAPMTRLTDAQFAKAGERVAQLKRANELASPRLDDSDTATMPQEQAEPVSPGVDSGVQLAGDQLRKQYDEVINVRRQLAIMSQVQDDFKSDVSGLLGSLREQAKRVRAIAASDVPTERNFILAGKARLDSNSQEVLTLVEDLLDSVDDLKADVIQRGVKPKPHTMKKLEEEIAKATRGLDDLSKYVDTVKPSWKKTWEAELQNIVDEQEFLNHQEGLIADLKEDHANLQDVFFNIQEVVKLRGANRFNLMAAGQGNGSEGLSNVALRTYIPPSPEEGHEGLPTVMLEVKSQAVDHEKRLKALQAAEKQRQKELKQRKVQEDDFQNELTTFVDGKALRKTGGYQETERVRGRRDKLTIQAMFGGGGVGGAPLDAGGAPQRTEPPRKLVIKKEQGRSTPGADDTPVVESEGESPAPKASRSVPAGYI